MVAFPSSAVSTWGGAVVFLNVLLTRLGVPIPAVPMLLFAGSAIAAGTLSFWPVLGAAVLGALIGDGAWFTAGRLYGRKLIAALGRLSPAVDSRVDKARALFERFGVPLVSISKFVPGLALVTPPLMGTTAVDVRIYAVWDFAGALAWAAFWLLGGAAAERQLHMLLEFVKARGGTVIDILLATALLYLAFRLEQRRRERRRFRDAAAAQAAADGWRRLAPPPKVLDARPQAPSLEAPCRIPGALALDPHSREQIDGALRAHDMVIYCICPDSATAFEITQRMRDNGYTRIRALRGGLDAWQRRGFPVEPLALVEEPDTTGRAPASRGEALGAITLRGFAPRSTQGV
ncbi:VTT domain-containing protein [Paraburkholderia sp. BL17N1]|uniref:VTT domain-containing protein n=1 Tax=Paraburkholderia sp. BL17N1 TaxID=1938798 RepID=UPI000EB3BFA2|nr:VTT domain-containing protein [Paraburkholderia sp. BL17N1]RKR36756.1 membrane protein DedA with SNARE-associated domain [Paraburkholderia sp. BL17N1]